MKDAPPRHAMLALPIHSQTRFVLVRPHYPENVGAAARAIKTMGFTDLALVKPSRIAGPDHEMAIKMAVKSWDVLEGAALVPDTSASVEGFTHVIATTSRRGVSGIVSPRQAATLTLAAAERGERVAFLFGNEKTGLDATDLERATTLLRIPMAADQPSINLAQAVQIVAYELFVAALAARERDRARPA
jgi:tRNA (cytidine32/uridine32-2'-O)-methyltransferase